MCVCMCVHLYVYDSMCELEGVKCSFIVLLNNIVCNLQTFGTRASGQCCKANRGHLETTNITPGQPVLCKVKHNPMCVTV